MTEEELRKYDKETFVQYFAQNVFFNNTRFELDRIQHRLRFDALYKRSGELIEEMQKIDTNTDDLDEFTKRTGQWNKLWKEHQKIQRKMDKLLEIY